MKKKLCRILSDLPNVPERVIFKVSLFKATNQRLGIKVVGGSERLLEGIFIKHIVKNGLADKTGMFQIGDQILTINDKNLRGLTHAQAVDYLQNCHSHISILVSRMVDRNTEIGPIEYSLSSFQKEIVTRLRSSSSDDEPDILEYKPIE